jgi:benzoyl-CoA-dihydrodiol lyase
VPTTQFKDAVQTRARALAEQSDRPVGAAGIRLGPLEPTVTESAVTYSAVSLALDRGRRTADLIVHAPAGPEPATVEGIEKAGDQFWPLRAFRELDAALLHLRINEPEIGTVVIRTEGDAEAVLAVDRTLAEHRTHWLVREIILLMKRTLKRLDLTSRTFFALIEPGSAFAGSLYELALAADRSYMLDDPERDNFIWLSPMNGGLLPMSNGLSRLQVRFLGEPEAPAALLGRGGPFAPADAAASGLVSFAPDEIDWEDEVRLAVEARAAFSPDALTGLEANLRFAGPETLETKIFGRLTAWQNWIFQRPNAVGEKGALQAYGEQGRPEFDWKRT